MARRAKCTETHGDDQQRGSVEKGLDTPLGSDKPPEGRENGRETSVRLEWVGAVVRARMLERVHTRALRERGAQACVQARTL